MLDAQFVNPTGEMRIEFSAPTCDLDKASIIGLSAADFQAALGRMHRFVRLQHKLEWRIRELDAALRALPPHDLTDDLLINLSHVLHLQDTLKVSLIPLLSWWSHIDTISHNDQPSLYEKLFLNKTVAIPTPAPDTDDPFKVFQLNPAGTELADTSNTIDEYAPAVMAALHYRTLFKVSMAT